MLKDQKYSRMFSQRSIGPIHFKAAQLEAKSEPFTVVSVCIIYMTRGIYTIESIIEQQYIEV